MYEPFADFQLRCWQIVLHSSLRALPGSRATASWTSEICRRLRRRPEKVVVFSSSRLACNAGRDTPRPKSSPACANSIVANCGFPEIAEALSCAVTARRCIGIRFPPRPEFQSRSNFDLATRLIFNGFNIRREFPGFASHGTDRRTKQGFRAAMPGSSIEPANQIGAVAMQTNNSARLPPQLERIERATDELGFDIHSERDTGALLRILASGKPAGWILELGTGTGVGTSWLLDGMDDASRLYTIDIDRKASAVAQRFLGDDPRVQFVLEDALVWLEGRKDHSFDLIFADANPGKYESFEIVWERLKPGGFYFVDDMLPQRNWPVGHGEKAERLLAQLKERPDCALVEIAWSTGLAIAAKRVR